MLRSCCFAVLGLSGLLVVACEPTLTPSGFDAQTFDISTTDTVTLPTDVTATADLSGTWVLVTDWSTCVAIGDEIELRNYELSRIQIVQTGVQLRETREDCSIANTPLLGMTTVVPPAAVASANPMYSTSFVPAQGVGAPYIGGVEVQTWGLKLANPETDAMPADANDPRVVDSDNDGHPGVTLKVGGVCDLYAVQRAIMVRSGSIQADGTISGEAARHVVQVPLGASQGFCAQPFSTVSNQTNNHWQLLRVDRQGLDLDIDGDGTVTCDEIVQNQAVFHPTWVDPDDTRCAAFKQP